MPQNRITDLNANELVKRLCLSHNHTQGYLLVNIFIVVFPFKIGPTQNKTETKIKTKTKQNKPKTMAPEKMHNLF